MQLVAIGADNIYRVVDLPPVAPSCVWLPLPTAVLWSSTRRGA